MVIHDDLNITEITCHTSHLVVHITLLGYTEKTRTTAERRLQYTDFTQ